MKKTLVYIDGYNLYYSLLKESPASKWLNLRALVAAMFKEKHEISSIKFFTARVRTYPHDIAAEERQKIYLQALASFGGEEIIEGFYSKKKIWLPHVNSPTSPDIPAQSPPRTTTTPSSLPHQLPQSQP